MKKPLVSVVVPVRDDQERLERLVSCLAEQTMRPDFFEVIIADDGSTQPVTEPLARAGGSLHISRGEPQGSFAARNRAAALTRGAVLAFTDADCEPARDWLDRGVAALSDADLVAGRVLPRLPQRPTIWSVIELGAWQDLELLVRRGGAVTANLFVRSAWFQRAGGFDRSLLSGADSELMSRCLATGARGVQAMEVVVVHETERRARPVLRRVWFRNVWVGIRAGRSAERPERSKLRHLVPGSNAWRRRREGLAARLDPAMLAEAGQSVSRFSELRARLLRDFVLSYLIWAAQLRGWRLGRRRPRS